MIELARPKLWSDFDGTAVSLVPNIDPRNWTKYPLPIADGYIDFLQGAEGAGVDIAGVVSRRPDIWPRRLVTERSIGQLGMARFFASRDQVILAGSESKKAEFVAAQAGDRPVGMIDDKPHSFGIALMSHLANVKEDGTKREFVIGAVQHPEIRRYIGDLIDWAFIIDGLNLNAAAGGYTKIDDVAGRFDVTIVPLEPYSESSGRNFAEELLAH